MTELSSAFAAEVEKANRSEAIKQKIAGWNKTFQLKPADSDPFQVVIEGGTARVETGLANAPVATLIMSSADMLLMIQGKLDPVQAFFSGKLKIEGNIFEAQALQAVLSGG